MSEETRDADPYAAVIADLRSRREQIDQTIRLLEGLSGHISAPPSPEPTVDGPQREGAPGAFLSMSIPDAAKKLLGLRKRALGNGEIAAALQAGGLVMNSADPQNTIGSILTRRFYQTGDIVRVGRGIWGLAEWYPGRNFKKKGDGKAAVTETPGGELPDIDVTPRDEI